MTDNSITRYTVTHIGKDGMRTLAFAAQGRYTWATPEEAGERLNALTANNTEEQLREFYGLPLEVRPVECWPVHFDPKGIYFPARYGIEVLCKVENKPVWQRVRPTGGKPYEYDSREEASRMMRLCYDADPTSARVVEIA